MHNRPHTEEAKLKMSLAKMGKRLSPSTEFKKGHQEIPGRIEALARGPRHHKWSEKPSYGAVHLWIGKQLGRPKKCSKCGFISENGRQFHWANISGLYQRDLSDWRRLCVKCHVRVDNLPEKRAETMRVKREMR